MLIRQTKEHKPSDEQLIHNYQNMDETGKEKLLEVSEKVLDIWQIVGKERKPTVFRQVNSTT